MFAFGLANLDLAARLAKSINSLDLVSARSAGIVGNYRASSAITSLSLAFDLCVGSARRRGTFVLSMLPRRG